MASPSILIYPRVALEASGGAQGSAISKPSSIGIWVGAFGFSRKPVLRIAVDGVALAPPVFAPDLLQRIRPAALLKAGEPCAYSGMLSVPFTQAIPSHSVTVTDSLTGVSGRADVRPVPASLDATDDGQLNILLVSCFYRRRATPHALGRALDAAMKRHRHLDLTLFLGDQVYLDLPTLEPYEDDLAFLARRFEEKYRDNWAAQSDLAPLLAAAPSLFLPDDHEYWNNAPEFQAQLKTTWTVSGREHWRSASRMMVDGFQGGAAQAHGEPVLLDLAPLHVFLADSRTTRGTYRSTCLSPGTLAQLRRWIDGLNALDGQHVGLFATGQSLLSAPASALGGKVGDYELSNYDDYQSLVTGLLGARRDMLLITGDVHWGRVCSFGERGGNRSIHEIISSPSALVETLGADQLHTASNWLKGLFGHAERWPRHSDPEVPPDRLAGWGAPMFLRRNVPLPGGSERAYLGIRGDHIAVMSLRRSKGSVEMTVSYYFASSDQDAVTSSGPIRLGVM